MSAWPDDPAMRQKRFEHPTVDRDREGSQAVGHLRTTIPVTKRRERRRTRVVTVTIVRRNSARCVLTVNNERPECQKKHGVAQNVMTKGDQHVARSHSFPKRLQRGDQKSPLPPPSLPPEKMLRRGDRIVVPKTRGRKEVTNMR